MTDTSTLRELAERATAGPWFLASHLEGDPAYAGWFVTDGKSNLAEDVDESDGAYIAAANPQAILALLDENELLSRMVKRMARDMEESASDHDLAAAIAERDELRSRAERAEARLQAWSDALDPNKTKGAYSGEFTFAVEDHDGDGEEAYRNVTVPWTTIKEIMAAICDRAAKKLENDRG